MKYTDEEKANMRFVGTSHGTTVVGHMCNVCWYNKGKFASFGEYPQICFFDITQACQAKMPYFFFQSRDSRSIAIFSKGRIPFEIPTTNTDSIQILKREMITALNQLKPFNHSTLYARYGTTDASKTFFDVENVLFYNIGTKYFHTLAREQITFATVSCSEIKKMHEQWKIPEEYSHYYEYTLFPESAPLPAAKELLAEWKNIPFCKCTGLTPSDAWMSVKHEAININIFDRINCDNGDAFSLTLEIEKPLQAKFNVMTAMKPLLDGLICAFHNSDFEQEEFAYFSQRLNCDSDTIQSNELSVLGKRQSKFVQIYRNNIKWNPADDMCCCVSISVKEGNQWRLSGKIYKM